MKGFVKCIIAGAVIIAVGLAVVLGTLAFNGWAVKTPEFEMNTYTAENDNTSLDIYIGAGSLKTEYYDGDKIIVEYPSSSIYICSVNERNGELRFTSKLKAFSFWGQMNIPDTVIKLPQNTVFNLEAEVCAGTVNIASGVYGKVEIDVSAGTLNINQSECTTFDCDISAGTLNISGLTCNRFDCDMSAGKMNVEKLVCPDISADLSAGMLSLEIDGAKADYNIRTHVSAGSCNVNNQTGNGGKKLDIECSAGTVKVSFTS